MSACLEVVQRVLQYSCVFHDSWKFAPDVLFAKIANTFYTANVFNETDLQQIAEHFALVIISGVAKPGPTWALAQASLYNLIAVLLRAVCGMVPISFLTLLTLFM